jgi:two-component system KDP operon response regulator KdpE
MKKILVVEDQETAVRPLKQSLLNCGYDVVVAYRGREALDTISQWQVDLVVLDLHLPDMSGHLVCEALRRQYPTLPIIILSVVGDEQNKVLALQKGADDYVSKPYYMSELLERINVQFLHAERMRSGAERQKFIAGPLEVYFAQRLVRVNGETVDLTYTEYQLLHVLVKNAGMCVMYDIILSEVWGDEDNSERQYIHVYVNRLRKKIEERAGRRYIYNVAKVGYRFQVNE